MVHELSFPFAAFAPFCFSPPGASLSSPGGDIVHFEKHCSRYVDVYSDTDNDHDASSTCLSDSFLSVCSLNQRDEDLAMSIKYRGVPFRLALTSC